MPAPQDFRDSPFTKPRVERCGRYLGRQSYSKLYVIENYLRVLLHSVLSEQMGATWLDNALDRHMKRNIERVKKDYLKKPTHTPPGGHDIYYLYLSDLNKIMAATSHLVAKIISDVNSWIAKIEEVRIPRNLVGHMNFPNRDDRNRIDNLHRELTLLVEKLEQKGFKVHIP